MKPKTIKAINTLIQAAVRGQEHGSYALEESFAIYLAINTLEEATKEDHERNETNTTEDKPKETLKEEGVNAKGKKA